MSATTFVAIAVILLLPLVSAAILCVALLERCERHLRALHVQVLGPLSPGEEARAIRRQELGLDDGYPHRQHRAATVATVGGGLLLLAALKFGWWWF